MKLKILIFSTISIIVAVVVTLFIFYYRTDNNLSQPKVASPVNSSVVQSHLQKRAEEMQREKYYTPIISLYEQMLKKFPSNIEIKKKLAFAYFGAGNYTKAEPLLNELINTKFSDEEVLRQLEIIKKSKPLPR